MSDTIRLVTKGCPDPYCEGNNVDESRLIYWNHTCGSNARLDRKGNIHCYPCNASYSMLNSQFKCALCKNWYKPDHTKFLLILGVLGTLKANDFNSTISPELSHKEFIDFINSVVDSLK